MPGPLVITAELHNWRRLEKDYIEGYVHLDTRHLYKDGEYIKLNLKYNMSEYDDCFIAKTTGGSTYRLPKDKEFK